MDTQNQDGKKALRHAIAGGLAGLVGDACVHPVDTLRTRLQAQRILSYTGLFDGFKKIVALEGTRAFYKGFSVVATMTIPAHSLYFGGYEATKYLIQPKCLEGHQSFWVHFVAGFVADLCGSTIWIPMDIVKQRLQMQRNHLANLPLLKNVTPVLSHLPNSTSILSPPRREVRDLLISIYTQEGIGGLYRGGLAGLLTYGPYVGIYFALYEEWKFQVAKLQKIRIEDIGFHAILMGGFICGAIAASITCPLDVIKTNIQVYSIKDGGYKNISSAILGLYQQGGLKAFSRGLAARVLWIAPGTAITISAYERCKQIIGTIEI